MARSGFAGGPAISVGLRRSSGVCPATCGGRTKAFSVGHSPSVGIGGRGANGDSKPPRIAP
eukprot:2757463-Heterocapsa_arctica.AAC.1